MPKISAGEAIYTSANNPEEQKVVNEIKVFSGPSIITKVKKTIVCIKILSRMV